MRVFSVAGLEGREFSDRLLRVADLNTWAQLKGTTLPLPAELKGLEGYDYVNAAALLCAIGDTWLGDLGAVLKTEAAKAEREARSQGAEAAREARARVVEAERKALEMVAEAEREARAIVAAHPHLAADPAAEIAPRWLAADHARKEWRAAILAAVEAGALVFLDPASKLPIRSEVERITPRPPQAGAAQEAAILGEIERLGLDPTALPPTPPGKAGIKAKIRDAFFHPVTSDGKARRAKGNLFRSVNAFDGAWERLRGDGRIAGG